MTDDRNPNWPWPRLYAEKIVREGGLEKAAQLLLDGEPEFDEKLTQDYGVSVPPKDPEPDYGLPFPPK